MDCIKRKIKPARKNARFVLDVYGIFQIVVFTFADASFQKQKDAKKRRSASAPPSGFISLITRSA
ncbi:MAG: hypothetical protein K2L42_03625 [Clostridia bacterium]|nr:hypothetical protein [Clostridia bacterium]